MDYEEPRVKAQGKRDSKHLAWKSQRISRLGEDRNKITILLHKLERISILSEFLTILVTSLFRELTTKPECHWQAS